MSASSTALAPSAEGRAAGSGPFGVLALALYLALAAVVCGPAIGGRAALGPEQAHDGDPLFGVAGAGALPSYNDPTPLVLDLPQHQAFARGLAAGRLDAWNPHQGLGAPLWADYGGPFFPLKAAFYLWPTRGGMALFLALRLVLAALGAFALGRRRGLSPGAATAAGALFELSGALFAHLSFASASAVYVLPWLLLAAQALADAARAGRGGRGPMVGAALAVGLAGHGGHPTLIAMVLAAFALAIAAQAVALRDARAAVRMLGWSLVAGALGLLLAAPALLPLAEMTTVARSYKQTDSGQRIWQTDVARFRQVLPIALFSPHLLEPLRAPLATLFPYLLAPVLGVLGLSLGLAGALAGGLGLAHALVLLLGVALATAPPGLDRVHALPGLRLVMPQYAWSLVALPWALCAGRALDDLAGEGVGALRGRLRLLTTTVVVGLGALSLRLVSDDPAHRLAFRRLLDGALATRDGQLRIAVPLAIALVAALLVAARGRRAGRGAALGVGALAILELLALVVPPSRLPVSRALSSPPPPAVAWLAERLGPEAARFSGRPYTVAHPNTATLYGLDDARITTPLAVERFLDFLTVSGRPIGFTVQATETWVSPILDLAAVRYFVRPRTQGPDAAGMRDLVGPATGPLALRYHDEQVEIFERPPAVPRFRVSHRVKPVPSREAALEHVKKIGSPADPVVASQAEVAVEPDAEGRPIDVPPQAPGTASAPPAEETVRRLDLPAGGGAPDPDRLVLEARLGRPGLVVIADTWYPGWSATVDGAPAALHPADLAFRALAVPAGTHRIELRYRPRSLQLGAALLLLGALACLGLLRARRGGGARDDLRRGARRGQMVGDGLVR